MMNQKQSSRPQLIRYLTVIPVLILMVLLFSNAVIEQEPTTNVATTTEIENPLRSGMKTMFSHLLEQEEEPYFIYIIDGKVYYEEDEKSKEGFIKKYTIIEKEEAIEKYGKKGEHGVVVLEIMPYNSIDLREYIGKDQNENTPLFIIDNKEMSDLSSYGPLQKGQIVSTKSIKSIPPHLAIVEYGDKGKNGAYIIEELSIRTITKIQTEKETDPKVYKVVDQMPRFPGCEEEEGAQLEKEDCAKQKMLQYIYKNITYPAEAKNKAIEGTVVLQFVVTKDGTLKDLKVVREIGGGCSEEAYRVVESMANLPEKWNPGIDNGKAVDVLYTLPIKFKLK